MTGNALVRARLFLGFTQEEMATRLGLSRSTYQRREALAEEALPLAESTQARMVVEKVVLDGIERDVWMERLDKDGGHAQVEANDQERVSEREDTLWDEGGGTEGATERDETCAAERDGLSLWGL